MFGVTLCANDIHAMIRDLRAEQYLLAAETLAECSRPISRKLSEPWDEEHSLEMFLRLLIWPNRSLHTIQRQLGASLTLASQNRLESSSSSIEFASEKEREVFHMIGYRLCRDCGHETNCADLVGGLCPECARSRTARYRVD